MRNLTACYLYAIVDLGYTRPAEVCAVAEAMIAGGVDLIQLRGKEQSVDALTELAADLHQLTYPAEVPLVVNDHPVIACRVPVEGVHVGQDDQSVESVRNTIGHSVWVGKSTHSIQQAVEAQREGADYIGFGPIYSTPTKPDYKPVGVADVRHVGDVVSIPVFCIGGIKAENLGDVTAAGAKRAVIVSGLLLAPDIVEYARGCKNLLRKTESTAAVM